MSRKAWMLLIAAVVVPVVLAVVGGIGLLLFRQHQTERWHQLAEKAYAEGDWEEARDQYNWYLPRRGDDVEALTKYALANLQIVENRQTSLRRAATAYHQILRYRPGDLEIEHKILDIYDRMGSGGTLEYYASEFLKGHPTDVEIRRHLAKALEMVGRSDEAVDVYEGLGEELGFDVEVHGALARLYRDLGNPEAAENMLDRLLQAYPDQADVQVVRAKYFAGAHQWERALESLEKAARMAPESPEVLITQAKFAVQGQEWERALELGRRALAERPEDAGVLVLTAHAHAQLGQQEEAIELLQGVSPIVQADNPEILITLAELEVAAGRYEEADTAIEAYQTAHPVQRPIADYLRARSLLARGRADEAIELLATVSELRPDFAPAQLFLATAYLAAGEQALGRSSLESYLTRNPDDYRAQALLAQVTRWSRPLDEVALLASDMLSKDSATAQVLVSTAFSLFDAAVAEGNPDAHFETVLSSLEKAIALQPELAAGYRGLAEVYAIRGQIDEARAVLERAEKAGVPKRDLLAVSASVALADRDVEGAYSLFEEYLEGPEADASAIVAWSNLFYSRGCWDEALKVLDSASGKVDADGEAALAIERVLLHARMGRSEEAWEELRAVEKEVSARRELVKSLNEARVELAQRLAQERTAEGTARARTLLEKVRKDQPEGAGAAVIEGQLLLNGDSPDEEGARASFERALEVEPENLSALVALGQITLRRGELSTAVSYTKRAIALAPRSMALHAQLADALIRLGRNREAEETIKRILAAHPDDVRGMELLVVNLTATKRFEEAQQVLEHLSGVVAGDADKEREVAALRGNLFVADGAPGEAESILRAEYEADPHNLAAARGLAAAYADQGRRGEAAALLEDFARANHPSAEAWVGAAGYYLADGAGNLNAASGALTRALLIEEGYLPALSMMIEVQFRRHFYAQALLLCDRYLEKAPDDFDVLCQKARVLERLDRPEEALASIQRAMEEERPEGLYTRAMIYFSLNEPAQALKDLQALSETFEANPARLDLALAKAHLELGRVDAARTYLQAAQGKIDAGESADEGLLRGLQDRLK